MTALLLALLLAPPTNLLPDARFQTNAWELTTWMPCQAQHTFEPAPDGKGRVVHLKGVDNKPSNVNVLAIGPAVPVEAGREYLLCVWYRTSAAVDAGIGLECFKQPFATAQWKTPTTAYWNRSFPASPNAWRLAAWRFTTPTDTVELKVLLRLSQLGDVWFDRPSLALASESRLTVDALAPFDVDGRRSCRANVAVPAGTNWQVQICAPDLLATAQGNGPGPVATPPFSAATGQPLQAVLTSSDGAVLDVRDGTAPPLVALELTTPRYRNAIYATARPTRVTAELHLAATPALLARLRYRAELRAGAASTPGPWLTPEQAVVPLRFATPAATATEARLMVAVRQGETETNLAAPLTIFAPSPGREVVVDEHQRLLVDGKPFLPCGYFGVPDDEGQIRAVAAAGNNMALTYNTSPQWQVKWLDKLQAAGLMGMVHVPWSPAKLDLDKVREGVRQVKSHPALLAWYLADEPMPSKPGEAPADLQRVYEAVKAEDPYHPIAVCIDIPDLEARYRETYDILMIDPYPLVRARQPVAMIGDRLDHAREAVAGRQPVWLIPQTFGWDVIEGLEGPPSYLTPTPEQAKAIYWFGLTHHAQGLVAYCYHVYTKFDAAKKKAGGWPWVLGGYLPEKQTRLWGALSETTGWLKRLDPWLQATDVTCGHRGSVDYAWYRRGAEALLVAQNRSEEKPTTVTLRSPLEAPPKLTPVVGAATVADHGLRLELPPLGVAAIEVR